MPEDRARACHGVAALVLAAGHGRRFGSDKRRARLTDGRTLLRATLDSLAPCFATPLVVLRAEDDDAALELPGSAKRLHVAPDAAGMGDSLATGVKALLHDAPHYRALAVVLGDMPAVREETLRRLCTAASAENIVRPARAGRCGHPVLFGRHWWPELAELGGDEGARALLQRHAAQLVEVAVDDDGIHRDVDTPEALP
ncbi:nucleotidyltransferase family protein [Kushneria aurantia]|uniref:Nucleotidyltransferase family protein n=1 Tax=Kushneria aurantia TaxID=504092 RepID=A0ABV6FYH7_9GAMM|nr:nucleotidyltransferase family protein [Kushneria aurantia]